MWRLVDITPAYDTSSLECGFYLACSGPHPTDETILYIALRITLLIVFFVRSMTNYCTFCKHLHSLSLSISNLVMIMILAMSVSVMEEEGDEIRPMITYL